MNQNSRYILNTRTKIAHRRFGLTEPCNTDDIAPRNRRYKDRVPAGYRRCKRCS
jgi:hypothetical protein